MLSRVACRKNAFLPLRRPASKPISLSATTLRLHSQSIRPTAISNTSASSSPEHPRRPSFQSNRSLATTTDHSVTDQGSYVPLEQSSYSIDYERSNPWGPSFNVHTNKYDLSSLIIVDEHVQTKPKILKKFRGIGGDEEEMMANFDISLKVGRFDRAASLIQRLGQFHAQGSLKYLDLHNRYVEAVVSHIIVTRQHQMILPLQKWFEVDMPNGGVVPDAKTFAIMIKMSLRMLHGPKRDRTVRRYWELAKHREMEEEVLAVPVLSELELGELSQICSDDLQQVAVNMGSDTGQQHTSLSEENDVEVRAVDQKGQGLVSLKRSLSLFSGNSQFEMPLDEHATPEEQVELYKRLRQRQLEADALESAMERWRHEFAERRKMGLDMSTGGKRVSAMMHQWHTDLVARIKTELELVAEAEVSSERTKEMRERAEYGVFLRALDPERIAALTILNVWMLFSRSGLDNGVRLSAVVTSIGKDLRDELTADTLLKQDSGMSGRRLNVLKQILAGRKNRDGRGKFYALVQKLAERDSSVAWPPRIVAKVGAVLMSLLYEVAKVTVAGKHPVTNQRIVTEQQAFYHAYQFSWGKRSGVIHAHPELVKLVAKEPTADLMCRHLPMVCEPRPWKDVNDGGYYIYETNMLRATPGETLQPQYIQAALENHGIEQVRSGLDVLGKTGWVINPDVFDVMLEAWNSGESIANLPPADLDLPLPPRPAPEEGSEAERSWAAKVREIENQKSGFHSNRCFQNFQMEVAKAYRNETFYFPHNIDFRGRAYPLPPYLNQMGADNCRGLLLFSEAKPLGESGLKWLKIQLANVFGYDKASFSEREKFTMDHLDDILDSANNGLHGRRWWLKAEDPWQCLAACCELRNALRMPDPTQYASRLPIHQDGSCNGLQHYAALGGDIVGAKQVNLEPSDRPSDVYTGVAEFVRERIAIDADRGDPVAQMLIGKVTRKVVKQTVMTNVYGVTFIGAMRQVRRQLNHHYPELPKDEVHAGALYVTKKIFEALGSMFNGAHGIQYWLGDCATRITRSLSPEQIDEIAKEALTPDDQKTGKADKSRKGNGIDDKFRTTVIWTTPLGLPVVQPYRTRKTRRIYTTLQDISIADSTSEDVVNRRRQLQAFPPNFIHSLDATHMLLSANECNRHGLTFSAVHDSFWTHAGDVDTMNRILRDTFVRIHSDDIVKRLAAEFNARYGQNLWLAKLKSASPIARAIRNAREKKGKLSKLQELLEEHKRQKLLNSDDPELQAQGRAMQTSASMFEALNGTDDDLTHTKSFGSMEFAHVPEDVEAAERQPVSIDAEDPALQIMFSDLDAGARPDPDSKRSGEKRKRDFNTVWVWLPLRFPDVPAKGDWDVTRIKESEYFFS